jgi:thiol-disulfide isomerase/thioredoxin
MKMPVFDSEFHFKITGEEAHGYYFNFARRENNIFTFKALRNAGYRFSDRPEQTFENLNGRWKIVFDNENDEGKIAVGMFRQEGNRLTGTIQTTTGDYRYLEGEMNGKRLWLSAFDGSHVFLFTAIVEGDSIHHGHFFSGHHWHDTWNAIRDSTVTLADPDSFTLLNPGYTSVSFSFPDENGKIISSTDEQFKNKVLIIQIMGSWCPNCMDETKFLSAYYNDNRNKDFEIIALDFEKIMDSTTVRNNIRRLKKRFDINYPVLFAGSAVKSESVKSLPSLSRVFAFPTTIFIDKNGNVKKIISGFSGPATGKDYELFIEKFNKLMEKLLSE